MFFCDDYILCVYYNFQLFLINEGQDGSEYI